MSKPFYVNPRYQDNVEKPTDFIMVKVVLFEDYEEKCAEFDLYDDLVKSYKELEAKLAVAVKKLKEVNYCGVCISRNINWGIHEVLDSIKGDSDA